jgi:hypothetical protein
MEPDQSDSSHPSPRERTPPDLLAWARQTFDEEEFLADMREIERTGGERFEDFIDELEKRVKSR